MRRIYRPFNKYKEDRLKSNEEIRAPKARVIDETGKNLGEMNTADAINLAKERGLDLIEVSPKVDPPVCKIGDYGKYVYEKEKKQRKDKARQKKTELKIIRLSLKIGKHDRDIKANQALKFFQRGDKVKLELILRGRERQHVSLAINIIKDFIASLKEKTPIKIEQDINRLGAKIQAIIAKNNEIKDAKIISQEVQTNTSEK